MARRTARLRSKITRPIDPLLARTEQHAATRGRNDLVAVERQDREIAKRAGGSTAIRSTERLRGVFDQEHAELATRGNDRLVVGALAVEIDRDHGLGKRVPASRVLEPLLQ